MAKNNGNPAGNLAHGVNDNRLSDLLATAGTYGEAAGTGDASIIALAWVAFDAAVDGAVTAAKPEAGEDDASQIYGAFAAGRAITSPESAENDSSRKSQVSKLRTVLKVGGIPAVRKVAAKFRADFEQAWADAGKPGIYGALVKVARAQIKTTADDQAAVMGSASMALAIGAKPDPKGLVEKLEAQRKALAKLNDGTEAEPGLMSGHVTAALAEIDKALAELLAAEQDAKAEQEKQAALGKMSKADLEAYLATLDTDIEAAA